MAFKPLMTVKYFRGEAMMGHSTFYKEVKAGNLKTVKLRGGTRVTQKDAEAYVEALRREAM